VLPSANVLLGLQLAWHKSRLSQSTFRAVRRCGGRLRSNYRPETSSDVHSVANYGRTRRRQRIDSSEIAVRPHSVIPLTDPLRFCNVSQKKIAHAVVTAYGDIRASMHTLLLGYAIVSPWSSGRHCNRQSLLTPERSLQDHLHSILRCLVGFMQIYLPPTKEEVHVFARVCLSVCLSVC